MMNNCPAIHKKKRHRVLIIEVTEGKQVSILGCSDDTVCASSRRLQSWPSTAARSLCWRRPRERRRKRLSHGTTRWVSDTWSSGCTASSEVPGLPGKCQNIRTSSSSQLVVIWIFLCHGDNFFFIIICVLSLLSHFLSQGCYDVIWCDAMQCDMTLNQTSLLHPRLGKWRRICWRQRRSCKLWWPPPPPLLHLLPLPPPPPPLPPLTARATTSRASTARRTAPTAPSCRHRASTTTARRRSGSPRQRRTSACRRSLWWVQGPRKQFASEQELLVRVYACTCTGFSTSDALCFDKASLNS